MNGEISKFYLILMINISIINFTKKKIGSFKSNTHTKY